ncbi:MAG: ribbon-helix-helix domain-containing protein [Pseudomonadota bacterium]
MANKRKPLALATKVDEPAETPKPTTARRGRKSAGERNSALYAVVPPEALRQLRIVAAEEDRTIADLAAEALNMLFVDRGKPPVA